jgi:threonine/homoserine/homoserine lactone efflux protein
MAHALAILLPAAGLGIAYAAAPGAVNTEAVRRGLAHGARSTLLVEAGSLIGDSLWAVLALTGVALFAQYRVLQVALGVVGGCFLLRLAWSALHDAWLGARPRADARAGGDFATGTVFGLANPVALAFWSGLGSSVIALGASGAAFVLFVAAFFAGGGALVRGHHGAHLAGQALCASCPLPCRQRPLRHCAGLLRPARALVGDGRSLWASPGARPCGTLRARP